MIIHNAGWLSADEANNEIRKLSVISLSVLFFVFYLAIRDAL